MMSLTTGKGRARAGHGTQVGIPHFLMLFLLKISFRWAEWSILLCYTVNKVDLSRIGMETRTVKLLKSLPNMLRLVMPLKIASVWRITTSDSTKYKGTLFCGCALSDLSVISSIICLGERAACYPRHTA